MLRRMLTEETKRKMSEGSWHRCLELVSITSSQSLMEAALEVKSSTSTAALHRSLLS